MGGTVAVYLIILLICILLSAFFSSTETAFISLQRIRMKHLASTGVERAERVGRMLEHPERLLATVLIGNNLVNTAAAVLGAAIVALFLSPQSALIVATVLVTILLLVFGEVIPKALAIRRSERLAFLYIRPIEVISWLFSPIAVTLARLSRVIGTEPVPRTLVTEEEIKTMVSVGQEEGVVERGEADMVHKVFRFGDRSTKELMTPSPDIVWVEKGTSLDKFLEIYAQFPHSRFPVLDKEADRVIGVLSIKDVLMAQATGSVGKGDALDALVRPIIFVPETKQVGELFTEMQLEGNQMAIVVDEYGSVAGLITLQQMVEEIVGTLGDELAQKGKEFEAIDEHTFQVDGSMSVEKANEEMGLGLPSGDYETVAGFILSLLGRIPEKGEQLKYGGLRIAITEMKGLRIEKILITREKRGAAPKD